MLQRISRNAFIGVAWWAPLLPISNVGSQFNPRDWHGTHIVSRLAVQRASSPSTLPRTVEALRVEHATAIRRFIAAINDQRAIDAVNMLSAKLVSDDAARQQWLQQFSAIESIHVTAIEPSAIGNAGSCYQYKVKLETHVSADLDRAVPFYGWSDNPNYRWIGLCPNGNGGWAISSFGTGP